MKTKTCSRFCALPLAASLCTLILAGSLQATTVVLIDYDDGNSGNGIHDSTVNNGSFESLDGNNKPIGWTTGFNVGSYVVSTNPVYSASDGSVHMGINNSGSRGVVQNTAYNVKSGDTFTLAFDWSAGYAWKTGDTIQWRLLTTDDDTTSGTINTVASGFVTGKADPGATTNYSTATVLTNSGTVTAPSIGQDLWLEIYGGGGTSGTRYAFLDAVSLSVETSAVPEPSPVALLGALLMFAVLRRRR